MLSDGARPFVRHFDDCAVVEFPPEVDLVNAPVIGEQLLLLLNHGVPRLIIDLGDARFCDSAGLAAIVRANRRAEATGTWLGVVLPVADVNRHLRKIINVTGLDRVVRIYPSLAVARVAPHTAPAAPPRTAPYTRPRTAAPTA